MLSQDRSKEVVMSRELPWKAFFPPRVESVSDEVLARMPWLKYAPDPEKPDGKPYYDWLQNESIECTSAQGYVCRSGASAPNCESILVEPLTTN